MDVEWVAVPAGRLLRGTPVEEVDAVLLRHHDLGLPRSYFAKEAPRLELDVPAFVIALTPVTVAQWNTFCEKVGRTPLARDTAGPRTLFTAPRHLRRRPWRWVPRRGRPLRRLRHPVPRGGLPGCMTGHNRA